MVSHEEGLCLQSHSLISLEGLSGLLATTATKPASAKLRTIFPNGQARAFLYPWHLARCCPWPTGPQLCSLLFHDSQGTWMFKSLRTPWPQSCCIPGAPNQLQLCQGSVCAFPLPSGSQCFPTPAPGRCRISAVKLPLFSLPKQLCPVAELMGGLQPYNPTKRFRVKKEKKNTRRHSIFHILERTTVEMQINEWFSLISWKCLWLLTAVIGFLGIGRYNTRVLHRWVGENHEIYLLLYVIYLSPFALHLHLSLGAVQN